MLHVKIFALLLLLLCLLLLYGLQQSLLLFHHNLKLVILILLFRSSLFISISMSWRFIRSLSHFSFKNSTASMPLLFLSSCPSCHLHYLPGFSTTLSASSFPLLVFSLAVTLSYSFCSPLRLFLCSQLRLRLRLSVISFKRTPSPSRSGDIPDARILPFLSLCT